MSWFSNICFSLILVNVSYLLYYLGFRCSFGGTITGDEPNLNKKYNKWLPDYQSNFFTYIEH